MAPCSPKMKPSLFAVFRIQGNFCWALLHCSPNSISLVSSWWSLWCWKCSSCDQNGEYLHVQWILIIHFNEGGARRRPCRKFICGLDSHILWASASCSYGARTAQVSSQTTLQGKFALCYCLHCTWVQLYPGFSCTDVLPQSQFYVNLMSCRATGLCPVSQAACITSRHGCTGCFPQTSSFIVPILFIAFATVLLALTYCTWLSLVPKILSGGLNRQFADNELFVHESL